MNEHNAQRLLIAWFRNRYPHLEKLLFAIPNGGARDPITAKRLKDEGVLPGVPDLLLAVPVGPYHGLFLELKRALTGRPSDAQKAAHAALAGQGYMVAMPYGYESAKAAIEAYFGSEASAI